MQGPTGKKGSIFTDGCYCLDPPQQTKNSEWKFLLHVSVFCRSNIRKNMFLAMTKHLNEVHSAAYPALQCDHSPRALRPAANPLWGLGSDFCSPFVWQHLWGEMLLAVLAMSYQESLVFSPWSLVLLWMSSKKKLVYAIQLVVVWTGWCGICVFCVSRIHLCLCPEDKRI